MPIRALIFDMDGVIADTEEFHYRSWQRLADEEGLPFSRTTSIALRGRTRRDTLDMLLAGRRVDEATARALMHRKNAYFLDYIRDFTPDDRTPGLTDLLEEARAAGMRLGVASSSRNVEFVLAKLNLQETFAIVGDGASVSNPKPAPDIFVWVAGGLVVPPPEALVFEDSAAGIQAARAGGFWTVGVGEVGVDGAHICLRSLADTRLADLLARVESLNGKGGA